MCSVIAPRLPTCRRSVPHLLEPPRACPRHPRLSQLDRLLPSVLFRVSLLDQGGPPSACRARWRPRQTARPGSNTPSPSTRSTTRTRLSPIAHDLAVRVTVVSKPGSVADAGTGLLETYVTGACSAHSPSWLTFGGAGQNWASNDRLQPPPSLTQQQLTGVVAAPESEHADRPGTIGTGVLIRASTTGPPGMLSRLRGGPVFCCWRPRALLTRGGPGFRDQVRALTTSGMVGRSPGA